jgi:hypothetical protein
MTYLGNTPTTQSFISGTDYFNGTGAQTAFTLSRSVASINDIQATVNNVVQQPNDAYTISGTTITFTSAPSAGTNNVYVRYLSTTTQSITPSQNTVSWNTLDSNVQGDLGISFKNRIINSNMVIDQRNNGATVNSNGAYPVDRFSQLMVGGGVLTSQRSTTAPTGFINSYLSTVSTADASIAAGDYYLMRQAIEGLNISDLAWGTANAKTVTLSFWVRSSVTGTFSGSLNNSAENRGFAFTYTINSANTFEYKTVTIVGDTSGTWLTTNGVGIYLNFDLGCGSNFRGTAGSWTGSGIYAATGATQLISTLNATWYVTGVQLEVGTQATTFTTAGGSYGAELALCQRYYSQVGRQLVGRTEGATVATMVCSTPVKMRTAPTFTLINGTNAITVPGVANYTVTIAANSSSDNAIYVSFFSTGLSNPTVIVGNIDTILGASSEL